jgi:hypothetical protein
MKSPKIAIIVVNWKGLYDTLNCLKSLENLQDCDFTTIVVDNNSNDGSVHVIEKSFPNVILIENDVNLGFGGGNNVGIRYAIEKNFDYIWLLNNDVIVESKSLNLLIQSAQKMQDRALISPIIYYISEPDNIWFSGGTYNPKTAVARHVSLSTFNHAKYSFLTACALFAPAAFFIEHGMFEESIFMYGEDVELSIRAKKHGYALLIEPQAKIFHAVSSSAKPGSPFAYHHHIKNMVRVMIRYHGLAMLFTIIPYHLAKLIYLIVIQHRTLRIIQPYLKGLLQGVTQPLIRS